MLMLTQRMNGRALECIICLRFLLNLFVENWKYHKVSYLIESNRKFMRKLMISDAPSHQLLLAFLYPGLESNEYIQNTGLLVLFISFVSIQCQKGNKFDSNSSRSSSQQHGQNNEPLSMG